MRAGEVHAAARAIRRFWLEETPAELHFARNDAFDAVICERFGELRERVLADGAAGWADAPGTLLAAVVLFDQFSRNLHRGSPKAFEADALARSLTRTAMRAGWDRGMTSDELRFLYMPLVHSENLQDQADAIAAFRASGNLDQLSYAEAHRNVIAQFGRFPGRNAALGRTPTAAELEYLSRLDAGW